MQLLARIYSAVRQRSSRYKMGYQMRLFTQGEAHSRSLIKAVSWRITGSIDTFVISFVLSGKISLAGAIASVEVVTKIALYYFHERLWAIIPWGR